MLWQRLWRKLLHLVQPNQSMVVSSPGSYLFEIENAQGERSHASLPQKFRKTIWLKRRDYVICEPIYEGNKVKYEIVKILQPDHIKQLMQSDLFPFKVDFTAAGDGSENNRNRNESESSLDDLPVNSNRRQYHYSDTSSESESDTSEEED